MNTTIHVARRMLSPRTYCGKRVYSLANSKTAIVNHYKNISLVQADHGEELCVECEAKAPLMDLAETEL